MTDYFDADEICKISEEVFTLLMERGVSEEEFIIFFISGVVSIMLLDAGYNSSEIDPESNESIGDILYQEIQKTGQRYINRLRQIP